MSLNIFKKRMSVHKKSKAFIAFAIIILLATNIANAAPLSISKSFNSVRVTPGLNSNIIAKIQPRIVHFNQ